MDQRVNRFADRVPADAKLLDELGFRGNAFADLPCPVFDKPLELGGDLFDQRLFRRALKCHRQFLQTSDVWFDYNTIFISMLSSRKNFENPM